MSEIRVGQQDLSLERESFRNNRRGWKQLLILIILGHRTMPGMQESERHPPGATQSEIVDLG